MTDDSIVRISAPRPDGARPDSQGEKAAPPRKRPAGLGRGLGALMGETRREEPVVSGDSRATAEPGSPHSARGIGLAMLAVSDIEPHPEQPRRHFDEAALDELARSIAARGVIQPIIVRPQGSGRYQLVAGERRWRAAQRARLHEIPAIVRQLNDHDVAAVALIENLQREDLNPVEEAQAYQRLTDDQGLSQQDIAKLVDKSRSHVANLMRLLALPREVQDLVQTGTLTMGHARALINVPDPAALAQDVVSRGLSVRATERLARKSMRNGDDRDPSPRQGRVARDPANSADIAAVQGHLEEFLGLKVTIVADADPRSGKVEIHYRTLDQLDLICQRLTGGEI